MLIKVLVISFIVVFMSACNNELGVETSSSAIKASSATDNDDDNSDDNSDSGIIISGGSLINPGFIDGAEDPDGGDNPDGGDDGQDDTDTQKNSIFDTIGAIEDEFACLLGDVNDGFTNNIIKDNSNDYLGEIDEEDGLGITSRYPFNSDIAKTEVALFYYDLKPSRSMDVKSFVEDKFTVSIDTAWADNEQKVMYVRTPKEGINDLYSCYRYDAQTIDRDGKVTITKVYRSKPL